MSFFYWVFPWMLPRMQRMSTKSRAGWCFAFYWLQLLSYMALLNGYTYLIPVIQFNPEDPTDPLGDWCVRQIDGSTWWPVCCHCSSQGSLGASCRPFRRLLRLLDLSTALHVVFLLVLTEK